MPDFPAISNAVSALTLATLAGCASVPGGGVGKTAGVVDTNPPAYANLSIAPDAAGSTVILNGSVVERLSGASASLRAVPLSGTYDPVADRLTLNAGGQSYIGNGQNITSTGWNFSTGTGQIASSKTGGRVYMPTGNPYAYTVNIGVNDVSGTGLNPTYYNLDGYIGTATASADMPTAGSATYTLQGAAYVTPSGATRDTLTQTGTMVADFAAATASVQLDTVRTFSGGSFLKLHPLAQINGTGIAITGNSFGGGNWGAKTSTGAPYDFGTTTTSMAGSFNGYDASISAPDEVTGVLVINGSTARMELWFLGD